MCFEVDPGPLGYLWTSSYENVLFRLLSSRVTKEGLQMSHLDDVLVG